MAKCTVLQDWQNTKDPFQKIQSSYVHLLHILTSDVTKLVKIHIILTFKIRLMRLQMLMWIEALILSVGM